MGIAVGDGLAAGPVADVGGYLDDEDDDRGEGEKGDAEDDYRRDEDEYIDRGLTLLRFWVDS